MTPTPKWVQAMEEANLSPSALALGASVKEKPIIFSAEMVRALMDGRKTQTRRVVKGEWWPSTAAGDDEERWICAHPCPYGHPGDRLWVREAWGVLHDDHVKHQRADMVIFRSTEGDAHGNRYQLWRSPIHMPRWASRLTLELTKVRVQRVTEISEEDAEAEGALADVHRLEEQGATFSDNIPSPRRTFRRLWDSLNAKRGYNWESNPWVFALTFRRVA